MPEPSTLLVFLGATLLLLVIPGPAVLYIVTRSVTQGRRAGLVSVLGIHLGSLVHVAAAVVGLSALIAASATAFAVVKFAGAGYLIYLGIMAFRSAGRPEGLARPEPMSMRRIFWQGAIVNILNPKTALFFLAFVPQFVDPALGNTTLQLIVLGGIFIVAGLISDGTYAMVAGAAGARFLDSDAWRRGQGYVAGTIYTGLGLAAAFTGGSKA
ncbi:MAG TPA: LysE family translocator [Acidimicrobiia bacterium]